MQDIVPDRCSIDADLHVGYVPAVAQLSPAEMVENMQEVARGRALRLQGSLIEMRAELSRVRQKLARAEQTGENEHLDTYHALIAQRSEACRCIERELGSLSSELVSIEPPKQRTEPEPGPNGGRWQLPHMHRWQQTSVQRVWDTDRACMVEISTQRCTCEAMREAIRVRTRLGRRTVSIDHIA
jgi:hypothetical protein